MSFSIRPARLDDVRAFADYVVAHVAESGRGGSPHFATSRRIERDDLRESVAARWARSLDEPLWGRAWLLVPEDGSRRVVGHLELRGGRVQAELHRAVLAMGMLRELTGRGYGTKLLETAIRWARDEARLAWIDLGVFVGNEPARRLYKRMGFVDVGIRRDAFRVDDGISIDDIHMTLSLRDVPAR